MLYDVRQVDIPPTEALTDPGSGRMLRASGICGIRFHYVKLPARPTGAQPASPVGVDVGERGMATRAQYEEPTPSDAAAVLTLTGAEAVVKGLESLGIDVVFGLCGHTNLALLKALEKSRIRFVGVRHEQVASHAADGYFRVTHRPAVVLTTVGPGLTNALTGVGDACLDHSAMIVIAGDVPTYLTGRDAFQEANLHSDAQQFEIFRPLVKRGWRVPHRSMLLHSLARAYNYSISGSPGPVLLDVPIDIFSEPANEAVALVTGRLPTSQRQPGDWEEIDRAATLLVEAASPVLFAGGGAVLSEAQPEITALAEHLGMPVVTSLSGQGAVSQDHPLSAGYIATVGTPTAHRLINSADLVLVVGSQLDEMETSSWNPAISFRIPPTQLIQVDIEPTQIGKSYPVEVGIQGDARSVLRQLLTSVRASTPVRRWRESERFRELRRALDSWLREIQEAARSDARPIAVERLLADIRAVLPRDGIFITDVGIRHQVAQQFPIYEQMTHYVASGWGTMGGAVAAALGAKIGRPDRVVVAEVGDGAFGSVFSPVITAVEYEIPVTWIVMNNYGYSSINVYQAKHALGGLGTRFRRPDGRLFNPDFAAMAEACGAVGRRVEDPAILRPALEDAIASGRPTVIDVVTESASRTRASGYWDVNDILSGNRFAQ